MHFKHFIFLLTAAIFLFLSTSLNAQEDLYPMRKKAHWGYINKQGTWVIKPRFDRALYFSEGLAPVAQNGDWGYINKQGEYAIEPQYNDGRNRPRYITEWGKPHYTMVAAPFSEGLAPVLKKGEALFIDKEGTVVIDNNYQFAYPFKEGLAAVKKNRKYGYINKRGEWVIEPKFKMARDFSEGLAAVRQGRGEWMYINKQGETLIKKYLEDKPLEKAGLFREGKAPVEIGWDMLYINRRGKRALAGRSFREAKSYSDGLAVVENKDRDLMVLDADGNVAIPPEKLEDLIHVSSFRNGLSLVVFPGEGSSYSKRGSGDFAYIKNGFYGYINKKGEFVYKQPQEDVAFIKAKIDSVETAKERRRKRREARRDSLARAKMKDCPQSFIYGDTTSATYIDFKLMGKRRRIYFDGASLKIRRNQYQFSYPPFGFSSDELKRSMEAAREEMSKQQRLGLDLFGGALFSMFKNNLSRLQLNIKKWNGKYRGGFASRTNYTLPDCMAHVRKKYTSNLISEATGGVTRDIQMKILEGSPEKPEKVRLTYRFSSKQWPEHVISGHIVTDAIYFPENKQPNKNTAKQYRHSDETTPYEQTDMEYHKGRGHVKYNISWRTPDGSWRGGREKAPLPEKGENLSIRHSEDHTRVYEFKALSESEIFINVYTYANKQATQAQQSNRIHWLRPRDFGRREASRYPLQEKYLSVQVHSKNVEILPLEPHIFSVPFKTEKSSRKKPPEPAISPIGLKDLAEGHHASLSPFQPASLVMQSTLHGYSIYQYQIQADKLEGKACQRLTYYTEDVMPVQDRMQVIIKDAKEKASQEEWRKMQRYCKRVASIIRKGVDMHHAGATDKEKLLADYQQLINDMDANVGGETPEGLRDALMEYMEHLHGEYLFMAIMPDVLLNEFEEELSHFRKLAKMVVKYNLGNRNTNASQANKAIGDIKAWADKAGYSVPEAAEKPRKIIKAIYEQVGALYGSKFNPLSMVFEEVTEPRKAQPPITVWMDSISRLPLKTSFSYRGARVLVDYRKNPVRFSAYINDTLRQSMEVKLPKDVMDLYQMEPALTQLQLKEGEQQTLQFMGISAKKKRVSNSSGEKQESLLLQPYFVEALVEHLGVKSIQIKETPSAPKKARHYKVTLKSNKHPLPGGDFHNLKTDPASGLGVRDYYLSTDKNRRILSIHHRYSRKSYAADMNN